MSAKELTLEDYRELYEKAVEFIDGRNIQKIPVDEVEKFTKGYDKERIKLALFYEYNLIKTDADYREELEIRILRHLWYQPIKPFLMRVSSEEKISAPKWGRYKSQLLSRQLSLMVCEGFCTYKDFRIEDVSRPKERPKDKRFKVGHFDEIVLFIEKETEFSRIRKLADLMGFVIECGKGQQATASIEGLIDYLRKDRSFLVLCIVDYDFYGFDLMRSMRERAEKLGINAEFLRIALKPSQLTKERIAESKYVLPANRKNEKLWASRFGIEGKYGLELEALTPKELRGIVAEAVYDFCDVKVLYKHLRDEALWNVRNKSINKIIEEDEDVIGKEEEIEDVKEEIRKITEELREKRMKLDDEITDIRNDLRKKMNPIAKKIFDEERETLDDREPFPDDWIRKQIVEYKRSSAYQYTDPDSVIENLTKRLRGLRTQEKKNV